MEKFENVQLEETETSMNEEPGEKEEESPLETPEEEALRNALILETILSYSSPDHLKKLRLVNKAWCAAGTFLALRHDYFQVRLKCHNFCDSFNADLRKKTGWRLSIMSLEKLNNLLEHSTHFPSSNFQFDQGNLGSVDVQEFFDIFGRFIKSLSLKSPPEIGSCVTSKETFIKILTQHAPNVEDIKIEGFDFTWNEDEGSNLILPSLKYIQLSTTQEFPSGTMMTTLEIVLRSAVNLQAIHSFSPLHTRLIEKVGKLPLIKTLQRFNVSWPSPWDIESTAKLTNSQLCQLQLAMPERGYGSTEELVDIFMKILKSSQNSLEKLELGELHYKRGQQNGKTDNYFPELPKLKKLILRQPRGSGGRYFPVGCQLDKIFPNLQTLVFGSCYNWDKHYLFLEEVQGPGLTTVENLVIYDNFSESCLDKVKGGFCPNFKRLRLHNLCRVDLFLPVIFQTWPHLESLTVSGCHFRNLDTTFTGFEKEECERLLREGSESKRMTEFEGIERGPWLGYCKELKSLRINFDIVVPFKCPVPPLSFVSGLYAFQLMPQPLQITIGYDTLAPTHYRMKTALRSMSPFSIVVHHDEDKENF